MDSIRNSKPLSRATVIICWLSTLAYSAYVLYVSVDHVKWGVDKALTYSEGLLAPTISMSFLRIAQ
jgi:hypothetical protein